MKQWQINLYNRLIAYAKKQGKKDSELQKFFNSFYQFINRPQSLNDFGAMLPLSPCGDSTEKEFAGAGGL